uniref:Uncharacterized protein n=1 Tax=Geospiza parvula TaxID=87175 RepID=A0A8U8B7A9_GEOPR
RGPRAPAPPAWLLRLGFPRPYRANPRLVKKDMEYRYNLWNSSNQRCYLGNTFFQASVGFTT